MGIQWEVKYKGHPPVLVLCLLLICPIDKIKWKHQSTEWEEGWEMIGGCGKQRPASMDHKQILMNPDYPLIESSYEFLC